MFDDLDANKINSLIVKTRENFEICWINSYILRSPQDHVKALLLQ